MHLLLNRLTPVRFSTSFGDDPDDGEDGDVHEHDHGDDDDEDGNIMMRSMIYCFMMQCNVFTCVVVLSFCEWCYVYGSV